MENKVVIVGDHITFTGTGPSQYKSPYSPREIIESVDGYFVDKPVREGDHFPGAEGKTIYCYLPDLTSEQLTEELKQGPYSGLIVAAKTIGRDVNKSLVAARIGAGTDNLKNLIEEGLDATGKKIPRALPEGVTMSIHNTVGSNSEVTAEGTRIAIYNVLSPDPRPEINSKNPYDFYAMTQAVLKGEVNSDTDIVGRYANGGWLPFSGTKPASLSVGIIGPAGHIGKQLVQKLLNDGEGQYHIKGWSPNFTPEMAVKMGIEYAPSKEALIEGVDVLSIHAPLNDQTRAMVGRSMFERAKPGLVLVNVSRGDIVNHDDFRSALLDGTIGGVVLDLHTLPNEPEKCQMRPYIKSMHEAIRQGGFAEGDKRIVFTPHVFSDVVEGPRIKGFFIAAAAVEQAFRNPQGPFINHVNRGGREQIEIDATLNRTLTSDLKGLFDAVSAQSALGEYRAIGRDQRLGDKNVQMP